MSLKNKITLMISLILIVMILVSINAIFNQSSAILNDEAEAGMIAQLDRANENVTLLLKNIVLETEKLSLDQRVKDYFAGTLSQEASDRFLTELMERKNEVRPVYMDLFLVDHEGIIVSAAMDEAVGIDVNARQYFMDTVQDRKTHTSDIILSRADNTQIVITLTPTSDNEGQVIGYTGIAIFATYFSDFLKAFEYTDDSEYIIVDSFDKIVSHQNQALISTEFDNFGLEDHEALNTVSFLTVDIDGEDYVVMERQLDFNSWRILSYLKVEEIYSKSRELSYTFFEIGMVFILIAIVMGIYITNMVAKPIVEITETINRIIEEEDTYKDTMINKLPLERLVQNGNPLEQTQEPTEISNFRKAILGFKEVLERSAKNFDVEHNQLKTYIDNLYHELDNINGRNLDFISTLSHDIRTPLTLIKGYARGLESGEVTDEVMEQRFKSGIVKSTNDIEHLIYNVLDFAYEVNDSKTYNMKRLKISDVVGQIVFEVNQLYDATDRKIELDVDDFSSCHESVIVDLMNINRVVVNLINNSLKYSEPQDAVVFSIIHVQSGVRFEVYDEGRGIKADELEKIKDIFYRTEASKDRKGYGLGLYICDQILNAHGIQLICESEFGKYTRMSFELPFIN